MRKLVLVIGVLLLAFMIVPAVKSDELSDINDQLNKLKSDLSASQQATRPLESDLSKLTTQLNSIKSHLSALDAEVIKKEKEVLVGEQALTLQKKLLDERTFAYYKNSKKAEISFVTLLTAENLSRSLENYFYQKTLSDQDKQAIIKISIYIHDLEERKKTLEVQKKQLAVLKTEVDKQSTFLSGEIGKAKSYQSELSHKIAQLSQRQQQIVAQKLSSLNIPQSAYTSQGGCVDDRDINPGFSPRLAFFTYGVPNRVGLNQYGAKGRAEAGQSAQDILRAYYNADYTTGFDTGTNIHVTGTNEYGQSFDDNWSIEEYVKHVYEMPSSWPGEALKAQAIAARSYALAYTNRGAGAICPSQSCQVVKKELNSQAWQDAVNQTAGVVLTQGGNPIKAWFSSTHGGYVFSSADIGWSATGWTKNAQDVNGGIGSFSDLQSNAYDKASPWFYCDWGSRSEYNKTAWLKPQEVADIVNVLLLAKADSSTITHLSQPDKSNPDGVETWNQDRVKSELRTRSINPFNSVDSVSVDWDKGSGRTSSISLSGDAGSQSFSGSEFKSFFNLRAPANIQIVGPLFNSEKR